MSTAAQVTADDLGKPPLKGQRCELIEGELQMMSPAGWQHGEIVNLIHALLSPFIKENRLGKAFGAETGFLLTKNPDTVRAPDFAFIAKQNLPAQDPVEAYWPGAPDIAVEVLSPNDRQDEVDKKLHDWLSHGATEVWIVNPVSESVTIHHQAGNHQTYGRDDTLVGREQLLPGLSFQVAELFDKFTG